MRGSARFSPCARYRYTLTRVWDPSRPSACFIMLNPSTADEAHLDPTVRRAVGYAIRWSMGGLAVVNAFALRSTDPRALRRSPHPNQPPRSRANDTAIRAEALRASESGAPVVCAWGTHAALHDRHAQLLDLLDGLPLTCLATTAQGYPKHPLYLKASLTPTPLR